MPRTMLSALAALVVTLAACGGGGGDSEAEIKVKVADQLAENGLDKKDSTCFAGVLVDEIGVDKLKDVDFSSDEPPAGLEAEFTAAALKALTTCNLDVADLNE